MTASFEGGEQRPNLAVGRVAEQTTGTQAGGELFHAEDEIDLRAQQTLFAQGRFASQEHFAEVQHDPESRSVRGLQVLEGLEGVGDERRTWSCAGQ